MQLSDIRAIVTGGVSGLGLAVAEHLVARGGKVALFDVNDGKGAEAVAALGDAHVVVLNKFPVIDRHLLIVTRHFEDQHNPLTQADFDALAAVIAAHGGLGFYNGGAVAGASQPHKHLQWVPLPLVEFGPAVPIVPLLPAVRRAGEVGIVPGLPFRHAFVALDPALATQPRTFAETMHAGYRAALQAVGIAAVHRAIRLD